MWPLGSCLTAEREQLKPQQWNIWTQSCPMRRGAAFAAYLSVAVPAVLTVLESVCLHWTLKLPSKLFCCAATTRLQYATPKTALAEAEPPQPPHVKLFGSKCSH